jgi:hypothetical protein
MVGDLRASIIVDYQNVHLTGHSRFASTRSLPRHETLVDPLLFAQALLRARNRRQGPGLALAVMRHVLVYRGEPSPIHDPLAQPGAEVALGARQAGSGHLAPAQV